MTSEQGHKLALSVNFRSQTTDLSEKYTIYALSRCKVYVTKFYLSLKYVGHCQQNFMIYTYVYTMMGQSPRCFVASFIDMGPPVPDKEDFKMFFVEDISDHF